MHNDAKNLNKAEQNSFWVLMPGAGLGERFDSEIPKQYHLLNDKTIAENSIERLLNYSYIKGVIVALSPSDKHLSSLYENGTDKNTIHKDNSINNEHYKKPLIFIEGGANRCESVIKLLCFFSQEILPQEHIDESDPWIWVHDLVRACFSFDSLDRLRMCLSKIDKDNYRNNLDDSKIKTSEYDGAILALPISDTLRKKSSTDDGVIDNYHQIDRGKILQIQTPQAFRANALLKALNYCKAKNLTVTDESSAISALNGNIYWVLGSKYNIKITYKDDLEIAKHFIKII